MTNLLNRCTRTQYLSRLIFVNIVAFLLSQFVEDFLRYNEVISSDDRLIIYFIYLVLNIYIIVAGIKRMHDVNKSGWFLFLPIINIYYLIFTPGSKGANKYGIDPRSVPNEQYDTFDGIVFSFLFSSFIACASYAVLNELHIVGTFKKCEVIKNTVFGISFISTFLLFSILYYRINLAPKEVINV